jgi:hypothetical protein
VKDVKTVVKLKKLRYMFNRLGVKNVRIDINPINENFLLTPIIGAIFSERAMDIFKRMKFVHGLDRCHIPKDYLERKKNV